jgi:hypothetical protein
MKGQACGVTHTPLNDLTILMQERDLRFCRTLTSMCAEGTHVEKDPALTPLA